MPSAVYLLTYDLLTFLLESERQEGREHVYPHTSSDKYSVISESVEVIGDQPDENRQRLCVPNLLYNKELATVTCVLTESKASRGMGKLYSRKGKVSGVP